MNRANLESLPLDIHKKIALNLSYNNVKTFCIVSKKLSEISNDIYFWRDYFKVQVPEVVHIPLEDDVNWYRNKIKDYPAVKKLTDLIKKGKVKVEYIQDFNEKWDIFEIANNLQTLYCYNNQLTFIPFLPNLIVLYCASNQLTFVSYLPNLKRLDCTNNKLTSIPYLPNLEVLYCANNQLTFIPYLPNLEVLECQNNPLPGFTLDYWENVWAGK